MMKRWTTICCGLAFVGAIACGEADDDMPDEDVTGMQMAISAHADAPVTHMKYEVYKLDDDKCLEDHYKTTEPPEGEPDFTKQKKLKKGITLPGGIGKFKKKPFDKNSKHRFADLFLPVDAGCYEVRVTPMRKTEDLKSKVRAEECLPVEKRVQVEMGKVTEHVLISQCLGPEDGLGAMDIVAALNGPPEMKDIKIKPQKFKKCPKRARDVMKFCVEATDPEKDPMNFAWRAKDGVTPLVNVPGIRSVTTKVKEERPGFKRECAKIEFDRPAVNRAYKAKVIVFDKVWDKVDDGEGNLVYQKVSFEDWYADRDITDEHFDTIESRATQELKFYVSGCKKTDIPSYPFPPQDKEDGPCNMVVNNSIYDGFHQEHQGVEPGWTVCVNPRDDDDKPYYEEGKPLVIDVEDVTVVGPNALLAGDDELRGDEAVIKDPIHITADGVRLDGFTIENTTTMEGLDVTFAHNKVRNTNSGVVTKSASPQRPNGFNIIGNDIKVDGHGLVLDGDDQTQFLRVKHNYLHNSNRGIQTHASLHNGLLANEYGKFIRNIVEGHSAYGMRIARGGIYVKKNIIDGNFRGVTGGYENDVTQDLDELVLRKNCITNNNPTAVRNHPDSRSKSIDARKNWWGDVDGPALPSSGQPNRISNAVLFDPWLKKAPFFCKKKNPVND